MRVLEIVPYYDPAWAFGGPPKVMSEEARELVRRGHEVVVFTTDALDAEHRVDRPPRATEHGVDVHRFRNVSNRLAFHRYRFQPRGMRAALRSTQIDVAHLSELRHELAILAHFGLRRRDIPLVVSAHGTLPRRDGLKGTIRRAYDAAFVNPMIQSAAALFAQTHHEASLYVDYGADASAVHVVPLGIDDPPPPTDLGSPDLGAPDDARIILFLGRIHRLKGVARLARAFAAVAGEHPDAWLVIAGRDDGGLDEARALADQLGVSSRVSFPGPLYGERRFDAYRRAALFAITPTHWEETSLASLEAASVGTPLLLSAQAEAPFLCEYDGGHISGADDDVAVALDEMLRSDLAAMGANAERMVSERHAWRTVGALVESIFSGVA